MSTSVHVVGLLIIVLSSVSHEAQAAWSAITAAAKITSALTGLLPATARYFGSATVHDGTTNQLNTDLVAGNFASLSAELKKVLQTDRSPLGIDYRQWVLEHQQLNYPPIEYIAFRDGVSGIAKAKNATLDHVRSLLVLMYKFCLHYHIDALICMNAAKENLRRGASPLTLLTAMRDDFKTRYKDIHERVHEKFVILLKCTCPSGVLHAKLQYKVIHDIVANEVTETSLPTSGTGDEATLDRHSLGTAAWVLAVHRYNGLLHDAVAIARSYKIVSSLTGNPPSGLIFETPCAEQQCIIANVKKEKLRLWYNQLKKSLVEYLAERITNWDDFFTGETLNAWFEEQTDCLKPTPTSSSTSTDIASSATSSSSRRSSDDSHTSCAAGAGSSARPTRAEDDTAPTTPAPTSEAPDPAMAAVMAAVTTSVQHISLESSPSAEASVPSAASADDTTQSASETDSDDDEQEEQTSTPAPISPVPAPTTETALEPVPEVTSVDQTIDTVAANKGVETPRSPTPSLGSDDNPHADGTPATAVTAESSAVAGARRASTPEAVAEALSTDKKVEPKNGVTNNQPSNADGKKKKKRAHKK